MTTFNHPSPPPSRWLRNPIRRLPALLQGGRIPLRLAGLPGCRPRVAFVTAEPDRDPIPRISPAQHALRQGFRQQRNIRRFRAADDEGQRDATPVHQETLLAPVFFPDPWGSVPQLPGLTAICSTSHQYSATPRQCCASRHTPSVLLATGVQRTPRPAILKNIGESHWDSRTVLSATLSTECRCAGHRRSPQRLVCRARVSVLRPVGVDIPDSDRVAVWGSKAPLFAKRYLRLPRLEFFVSVSCWTTRMIIRFLSIIIYGQALSIAFIKYN
jgi:hypothetical protein